MNKTPDQLAKQRAQAKARRADPAYREKWNGYLREYMKEHPLTREQKDQRNAAARARRADPEWLAKRNARRRMSGASARTHRLRTYGLTDDSYKKMLASQRGSCALCGRFPSPDEYHKSLTVDHDHETNAVRGLLCWTCNRDLGGYERILKNIGADLANRYLDGWPKSEQSAQEAV